MGMQMGGGADVPMTDTAETVYISSLSLLKMLKHGMYMNESRIVLEMGAIFLGCFCCFYQGENKGDPCYLVVFVEFCWNGFYYTGRAGVPFEVMGLMLGDFVDDYTVKCVDVFAMPQRGTSMTVEAVDPVFQQQMLEMLKQTGRYDGYRFIQFFGFDPNPFLLADADRRPSLAGTTRILAGDAGYQVSMCKLSKVLSN